MKKQLLFCFIACILLISSNSSGQFQKVFTVNNNIYALASNSVSVFAGTGGSIYRYPSIPVHVDDVNRDVFSMYTYPAHLSDFLVVETAEKLNSARVSIFNIQGQQLITEPLTQKKTILEISVLEKGVYIVSLSTPGNDYIKKFINN
ncbi:MAG: T9SS type A sorting domain-containing protein [Bacteroidota bacterium]